VKIVKESQVPARESRYKKKKEKRSERSLLGRGQRGKADVCLRKKRCNRAEEVKLGVLRGG